MVSKANWKAWVIMGAAVALFVTSGGFLMASNMGFKINKGLVNNFPNPGPKGDNWISFPYNNPYLTLTGVCENLRLAGANPQRITISRLNPSTGIFLNVQNALATSCTVNPATLAWVAGDPGAPVAGTLAAIRIRITGNVLPGSPTNGVFVGSSNETQPLPKIYCGFKNPGPQFDNWLSVPYHTTWAKALEICSFYGLGTATTPGAVAHVNATTGIIETCTCSAVPLACGGVNFSIGIGEGIRIRKNALTLPAVCTDNGALAPPHF